MLKRIALIVTAALVGLVWAAIPARAAPGMCPPGCGDGGGGSVTCRVCDSDGGDGGGGDSDGGDGVPDLPRCPAFDINRAVPDDGDWLSINMPQYGGYGPPGWAHIHCLGAHISGDYYLDEWWYVATVDPETIARQLLRQMNLTKIDMGMVPRSGAGNVGTVGVPVWMWVDNPSPRTWGPNTISAGGVTLTARATKVVWSMGDGTKVTCQQGTEWTVPDKLTKSPTCGHVYDKRGRVTITATTYWTAHWTGMGQSGDINFRLTNTRTLQITEIQVVVTGP
jgi:hypothetical protein